MLNRRNATRAGLLVLGILLSVGFVEILEKRFTEGTVYPHYASFRPDPLGTSVLYESLDALEGIEFTRNVTYLQSISGLSGDSALLLLGYPRQNLEDLRAPSDSPVMAAVARGARLVLTLNPELVPEIFEPTKSAPEKEWMDRRDEIKERRAKEAQRNEQSGGEQEEKTVQNKGKDERSPAKEKKVEDSEEEKELKEIEEQIEAISGTRLTDKLDFDLADVASFERPEEGWETERGESISTEGVPEALPFWHSQYRFETDSDAWKVAVSVEGDPVVIERKFGKGSVVVATDSFFVSNESMNQGGEPEFLLWLLGGKTDVVIDETIHGTRETGGAMKLMRRYRVHGFFLGFFVVIALWAWRSASPLAPGSDDLDRGIVSARGAVSGAQSDSGLIQLLRRSVQPSGLLAECLTTWKSSQTTGLERGREEEVKRILARHESKPKSHGLLESYRNISAVLKKRSFETIDKQSEETERNL